MIVSIFVLAKLNKLVYYEDNDCMTGGSRINYRECSK